MHFAEELSFTEILCCTHTRLQILHILWWRYMNTSHKHISSYAAEIHLCFVGSECKKLLQNGYAEFLSLLSATEFLRCFSTWSNVWGHCPTVIKMKSLRMLWKHMWVRRYRSTLNISTVWRWVLSFTALPLYQLFSLYPLNRRLVGPRSQFRCIGEEKNLVLLCDIKPWFLCCPFSSLLMYWVQYLSSFPTVIRKFTENAFVKMYLQSLIKFLETRQPLLAKEMAWELVEIIQIMEDRRDSRPIPIQLKLCSQNWKKHCPASQVSGVKKPLVVVVWRG